MHNLAGVAGAGAPAAADVEPRFFGDGRRFVRLLVRGGLLQLVTFGFYRFWLLTDIRNHLWSGTSIDGDALEYLGRGRELLIGFQAARRRHRAVLVASADSGSPRRAEGRRRAGQRTRAAERRGVARAKGDLRLK